MKNVKFQELAKKILSSSEFSMEEKMALGIGLDFLEQKLEEEKHWVAEGKKIRKFYNPEFFDWMEK